MASYEGVGGRLGELMLAKGYKRDDGKPDVQRFCWDYRFDRTLVYDWLNDRATPFKDLTRLCDALECSEKWLLVGEEREAKKAAPARSRPRIKSLWLASIGLASALAMWPSGGVLAQTGTLQVREFANEIPLLGSKRRKRQLFQWFNHESFSEVTPWLHGVACA